MDQDGQGVKYVVHRIFMREATSSDYARPSYAYERKLARAYAPKSTCIVSFAYSNADNVICYTIIN